MTADIRTAAQREAERIWPLNKTYTEHQQKAVFSVREVDAYNANSFQRGAEWGAARVPSRDDIADVIGVALHDWLVSDDPTGLREERAADAVLRLIHERMGE